MTFDQRGQHVNHSVSARQDMHIRIGSVETNGGAVVVGGNVHVHNTAHHGRISKDLVTVERVPATLNGACSVCKFSLEELEQMDYRNMPGVVQVSFFAGPHFAHQITYCEQHFAEMVAELTAGLPT